MTSRETAGPTDAEVTRACEIMWGGAWQPNASSYNMRRALTDFLASRSGETGGRALEDVQEGPRQGGTPPQFPVAELPCRLTGIDIRPPESPGDVRVTLNVPAHHMEHPIRMDDMYRLYRVERSDTPKDHSAASSPVGDRDVRALALKLIEATGGDPDAAKSAVAYAWHDANRAPVGDQETPR